MSAITRITGIVFSPGKTMKDLAERPRILFPLLITAFTQLVLYLIRFPLYKQYMRSTLQIASEYMESMGMPMTAEMAEQSLESQLLWSYATVPLGSLAGLFIITFLLFAICKIFGGSGKFKAYLSVVGYSYVIFVLYNLIVLAVSFITNSLSIDLPLTSIVNLFDESMKGTFLYGVLRGLDVFAVWQNCVIAVGLTYVDGFKKRKTTYIIVAIVFVLGLVVAGAAELAAGAMI